MSHDRLVGPAVLPPGTEARSVRRERGVEEPAVEMEGGRVMSAQPRWEQSEERFRPAEVPAPGTLADQDRNAAAIVTVIAMASIASGAINIAAAASIPGLNGQSLAFFWTIGVAQVVWGLVTLVWAPRWWLALGALGNAVVAATWLVSRTVALPFGQFAHVVLPARFADALAQILAVVVVIGAAWLAVRGSAPARSASRVRGFALAAAIVIGALGVAGVISQANAFASGSGGGGGQNGPTAPYGGGGGGGGGYGYCRLPLDRERWLAALGRIRPSAAPPPAREGCR